MPRTGSGNSCGCPDHSRGWHDADTSLLWVSRSAQHQNQREPGLSSSEDVAACEEPGPCAGAVI